MLHEHPMNLVLGNTRIRGQGCFNSALEIEKVPIHPHPSWAIDPLRQPFIPCWSHQLGLKARPPLKIHPQH